MKERCNERSEDFCFDVTQTRLKFKRCVTLCRNAVMKVKTASGIKRFQEDKKLGNWFGKLLPLISSMKNCQPQQSIEPGQSQMDSSAENDAEVDDENSDEEENPVTPDSSDSLASTPNLICFVFLSARTSLTSSGIKRLFAAWSRVKSNFLGTRSPSPIHRLCNTTEANPYIFTVSLLLFEREL